MRMRCAARSRPGKVMVRLPMASIETSRPMDCAGGANDVVRGLLTVAVAVAHDAAAAARRARERLEQRGGQLEIGLDRRRTSALSFRNRSIGA